MIESNKAQKAHWIFDSYNILKTNLELSVYHLKRPRKFSKKSRMIKVFYEKKSEK